MYPACAVVGCTKPFHWCEIHHIVYWERRGVTDLANLIPLCCEHHHLVHDQRWTLTLDARRRLTITRPDSLPHATATLPTAPQFASADPSQASGRRRPPP